MQNLGINIIQIREFLKIIFLNIISIKVYLLIRIFILETSFAILVIKIFCILFKFFRLKLNIRYNKFWSNIILILVLVFDIKVAKIII